MISRIDKVVTREVLISLLELRMCSDPFPLDEQSQERIDQFLNDCSYYFGYKDWIDAYHQM